MNEKERPRVCAIHRDLEREFKIRKEEMEELTGNKIDGGLTTISQLVAHEIRLLRGSKEEIEKRIAEAKKISIKKFNEVKYIEYQVYQKLLNLCSILSKKKDNRQIIIDISKIRGLKKNELEFFW